MTSTSKTTKLSGQTKPIVFFGTEDFSLVCLRALIDANYPIAAVVTKPDSRQGRGLKMVAPKVKTLAQKHQMPVWQPTSLSAIAGDIKKLNSPVGVLVSYGRIIPQSIIDLFDPGIINIHPSLLPKYRGPSPIESAIAGGDSSTGVTIMQLSATMDAGPIYAQITHKLTGRETRPELYSTLAQKGAALLIKTLPDILNGNLIAKPQDERSATYCSLLSKADTQLDTSQVTAAEAERIVRAHLGFPRTKINVLGHTIIITKAHVTTQPKTPLDILCQDGACLAVDELIAPSGKTMNPADFLRGYAA